MLQNFKTYTLAIEFYRECQGLKLKGSFKDQFERALLNIPLNLSEGSAKPTAKDRRKFYFIALGSIREVQTLLHLHGDEILSKKCDVLAAHCYRLPPGLSP